MIYRWYADFVELDECPAVITQRVETVFHSHPDFVRRTATGMRMLVNECILTKWPMWPRHERTIDHVVFQH